MKNAGDEKRVIANVCTKQKRLFGSRAGQRDEHVGKILLSAIIDLVRHLQPVRARKSFKQRRDVIAQLAVADPALLQNVPRQNIKIKLRRYPQMFAIGQNSLDQSRMRSEEHTSELQSHSDLVCRL